jgi:hypothetical protein
MLSNPDETVLASPFADEDPFAYGDQTVLQLRAQPFAVQDELGTVVTMPIDTDRRQANPALNTVFAEEDPIARLEAKLDTALRQIAALEKRLESLDLTLARTLAR